MPKAMMMISEEAARSRRWRQCRDEPPEVHICRLCRRLSHDDYGRYGFLDENRRCRPAWQGAAHVRRAFRVCAAMELTARAPPSCRRVSSLRMPCDVLRSPRVGDEWDFRGTGKSRSQTDDAFAMSSDTFCGPLYRLVDVVVGSVNRFHRQRFLRHCAVSSEPYRREILMAMNYRPRQHSHSWCSNRQNILSEMK